jgi:hypothetical protein
MPRHCNALIEERTMKNELRMIAFGAILSMTATAVPSLMAATPAGAQDQDHRSNSDTHPDYSKNPYYKLGNREGYQDHQHKTQRTAHNHNYRNDEDRKAHDYGYQQGLQGQRGYHPDQH